MRNLVRGRAGHVGALMLLVGGLSLGVAGPAMASISDDVVPPTEESVAADTGSTEDPAPATDPVSDPAPTQEATSTEPESSTTDTPEDTSSTEGSTSETDPVTETDDSTPAEEVVTESEDTTSDDSPTSRVSNKQGVEDNTNSEEYWEAIYGGECTKIDPPDTENEFGYLNEAGNGVILYPNDNLVALIIKAGNVDYGNGPGNNVIENPVPGTEYLTLANDGGNPHPEVSHWIVCVGTPPPPVDDPEIAVYTDCEVGEGINTPFEITNPNDIPITVQVTIDGGATDDVEVAANDVNTEKSFHQDEDQSTHVKVEYNGNVVFEADIVRDCEGDELTEVFGDPSVTAKQVCLPDESKRVTYTLSYPNVDVGENEFITNPRTLIFTNKDNQPEGVEMNDGENDIVKTAVFKENTTIKYGPAGDLTEEAVNVDACDTTPTGTLALTGSDTTKQELTIGVLGILSGVLALVGMRSYSKRKQAAGQLA